MKKYSLVICFVLLVFSGNSVANNLAPQSTDKPKTGIFTFYPFDPLAGTLCFTDGECGSVVDERRVKNRCSHLTYDRYEKDQFRAGIQGGDLGFIVDLGAAIDLKKKYSYQETVGNGQGLLRFTKTPNQLR